ncbi:hypothetical protein COW36_21415 [bacterium (Candidatus Blackallbacteria) CG17_big_fil_post_rev_8_21_14_2_50_48_46]|uniref:Uncharacterized protein n=1 Tax=bacterium (Candidatus Blackallbacteria) CG17_big_fil_post_rev_8_21_14_2_50_48_46 TaxID=2014261 RepID=A0A2M7FZ68_9BACT|nr:MAG: hypothetical protein COW64_14715 [bacterium (Candidatus Blackallbacteria) CG18_big_fil_WC_8_21_14_2_50_49_26]PIW14598.1 MAG: hypothetical protein COW36_21415 [bacterium (Candidatus Blackallbacteria) CG17_big_fil_post_rev_8_21_14_2_50_48_46]PIW45649.1 MAG: hypothetical protein COW20_19245 [bacterium (Candidatus Blackallbacteria) CG13_big_fil_rev_8_21_14_2_50_49_14]
MKLNCRNHVHRVIFGLVILWGGNGFWGCQNASEITPVSKTVGVQTKTSTPTELSEASASKTRSLEGKFVLEADTLHINYGESLTLTGSGFSPYSKVNFFLAFPKSPKVSGLIKSASMKADKNGKVVVPITEDLYRGGISFGSSNQGELSPEVFVGDFRAVFMDEETKKYSNTVIFNVKYPEITVNPSLELKTKPASQEGYTWLILNGSGFSFQGKVNLLHSSPPGVELETIKLADSKGNFSDSFMVNSSLAHGLYCFKAEDLSSSKIATEVCQKL